MTLAERIFNCFKQRESFTLNDAYQVNSGKPHETIRARIYDNLGIRFERIAKGIYKTLDSDETCILLEGDGRDLSMLEENILFRPIMEMEDELTNGCESCFGI